MAAEAHGFVADAVLEPQNHADGDDHHSQTDSDAYRRYTYGGTAHFLAATLICVYPLRYE